MTISKIPLKSQPTQDGWPIKELWEKYEDIAMHFNELLIKLRTQALAGVAAISTLVSLFAKFSTNIEAAWEISAAVFFGLCLFWIAIWLLDFLYYNRLLLGAVIAISSLEKLSQKQTHTHHINLSTYVEMAVQGNLPSTPPRRWLNRSNVGRWAFYFLVFVTLLGGFTFSARHVITAQLDLHPPQADQIIQSPGE